MFTSRAEYRLLLREDNADLRLTGIGRELGLVDDQRWQVFSEREAAISREQQRLGKIWMSPEKLKDENSLPVLGQPLTKEVNLLQLLRRPEVSYPDLLKLPGVEEMDLPSGVAEQVEIQAKYHGYIERQQQEIDRMKRDEHHQLPSDLDYANVRGLSTEVIQKLNSQKPVTLAQAARIPGITPAAISLLRIHLKKRSFILKETA